MRLLQFRECCVCGSTEKKHAAKGLCAKCYRKRRHHNRPGVEQRLRPGYDVRIDLGPAVTTGRVTERGAHVRDDEWVVSVQTANGNRLELPVMFVTATGRRINA